MVAHVMQIREQLQQMTGLVEQNMEKAQDNQKKWYDRNARTRKFEPGDQVLVLLPTSTSKLLAQWLQKFTYHHNNKKLLSLSCYLDNLII